MLILKNKPEIALLSNVNLELLGQRLKKVCGVYLPEGYNGWVSELLMPESGLWKQKRDVIFVLLDGKALTEDCSALEEGKKEIEPFLALLLQKSGEHPDIDFFISTLDIPCNRILPVSAVRPEREWEYSWFSGLMQICEKNHNVYCYDLKELVEELGREQFYSGKMWYMGGIPFSIKGMSAMEQRICQLLSAWTGQGKKVFSVDLDNTLWGGVIGEDGFSGIILSDIKEGARYRDAQRRLKELKETGALLGILSKNNKEDIFPEIEAHAGMVLKEVDFAAEEINWNSKPENLTKMAKMLNLGTDSFVFLDDNPAEREWMEMGHPETVVLPFPNDTSLLAKTVKDAYWEYFLKLRLTKEDLGKSQMYQQEGMRKKAMQEAPDMEAYLKGLEMRVQFHTMQEKETDRVVQLLGKTNQFNLTTKRYSKNEVLSIQQNPEKSVFTVSVKDKYGDMGLVSVLILKYKQEKAYIDTFLMSCRVMGRYLEYSILEEAAGFAQKRGAAILYGEYRKTAKNKPVEDFYQKAGLKAVMPEEPDSGNWYAAEIKQLLHAGKKRYFIQTEEPQE